MFVGICAASIWWGLVWICCILVRSSIIRMIDIISAGAAIHTFCFLHLRLFTMFIDFQCIHRWVRSSNNIAWYFFNIRDWSLYIIVSFSDCFLLDGIRIWEVLIDLNFGDRFRSFVFWTPFIGRSMWAFAIWAPSSVFLSVAVLKFTIFIRVFARADRACGTRMTVDSLVAVPLTIKTPCRFRNVQTYFESSPEVVAYT